MPYKDKIKARQRAREVYAQTPLEIKLRWREANAERRRQRRLKLVAAFGGKCIRCGFKDSRALQFDHKNSDGQIDRHLERHALWKEIEQKPERFQLLCANCNTIKRFECNELN